MGVSQQVNTGHAKVITVSPVLTVHANYAAGDYVGTSGEAMTFDNAGAVIGGSGVIVKATLIDAAKQSIAGELWLFDAATIPPDDSAAWALTAARMANCIGIIPFTTYYAAAAQSVSISDNVALPFTTPDNTKDIYGCFVTRGAPTYASLNLTFRLHILQDIP